MTPKNNGNICILLGAGASTEQNLPEWIDLIESVKHYFNISLHTDKSNLTESIGIIEDNLVTSLQQNALDAGIVFNSEDLTSFARRLIAKLARACLKKSLVNRKFDDVVNNMMLMKTLAECVYDRILQKKLTTIITYNYDDYFEFALKYVLKKNGKLNKFDKYLTSYTIGDMKHHLPSGDREATLVNVYHVHGFIPIFDEVFGSQLVEKEHFKYQTRQRKKYDELLDRGIILSSNDYNTLIDETIVGWTNMIQYICYSQLPVLIIGFSLTDPNFRALIRRMKKSKHTMREVKLILGYSQSDNVGKESAESHKASADYIFKGLCESDFYNKKICTFGEEYSKETRLYLESFL